MNVYAVTFPGFNANKPETHHLVAYAYALVLPTIPGCEVWGPIENPKWEPNFNWATHPHALTHFVINAFSNLAHGTNFWVETPKDRKLDRVERLPDSREKGE